MRFPSRCAAILAVAISSTFVAATEPSLAAKKSIRVQDPIVQAVKKTINSVVAIRITQPNEKDIVGSGVIVDEEGVIVTNRHVIGGKRHVKVRLQDRTDLDGEVVFHDPDIDLAIVKIKTNAKLQRAPLGAADDIILAEQAIAIGSPYGYDGTVSVGRISAKDREIRMPNGVMMKGLLQTTAAINPGNSGGPLININGEVIGINVAMRDGAQNIAFAINTRTVDEFLKDYYKRVSKVAHGLTVEKKVVADEQVIVVKQTAQGQIQQGDQIVKVADAAVANEFEIERALEHKKPGEQVAVQVLRGNRQISVMMTLSANDGAGQVAAVPQGTTTTTANVRTTSQR